MGGEAWEVLSIPAEAEDDDPLGRLPGALLWPEWFSGEMFAEAKRDVRRWASLYQQKPAPEEGFYFKQGVVPWIRNAAPDRPDARVWIKRLRRHR